MNGWNTPPEACEATGLPFLAAPSAPEGRPAAPQGTYLSIDPPINLGTFSGASPQMFQAQMPYAGNFDPAWNFGYEPVPAPKLLGHVPNTVCGYFGLIGDAGGFIGVPDLMIGIDPRGTWANLPLYDSNVGGWVATGDIPARNGRNNTIESSRLRGIRPRPQKYEGDVGRLYDRLIHEGADLGAALILRYIIFADGVTVDALMAPVSTPEMIGISNGATRMWGLLLERKEMVSGKRKYRCLLCPLENRREYGHNRDAVRHFNKDHFGFSFQCEYW